VSLLNGESNVGIEKPQDGNEHTSILIKLLRFCSGAFVVLVVGIGFRPQSVQSFAYRLAPKQNVGS
jgi:hypothetical protein